MSKINLVVTRHPELLDFLANYFQPEMIVEKNAPILEHATEQDVRFKHVFGSLPFRLACLADRITEATFDIPLELRKKGGKITEFRRYFVGLRTYRVRKTEFQGPAEIVVSRHPALKQVLIDFGLAWTDIPILAHATENDARNKRVAGVLPLRLACLTRSVSEITLDIPKELLGTELDETSIRLFMVGISTYTVERLSS